MGPQPLTERARVCVFDRIICVNTGKAEELRCHPSRGDQGSNNNNNDNDMNDVETIVSSRTGGFGEVR